jgi:hypothetical protein
VYSGDGSTTAFTLEQAVVQDEDILVSVDGVVQEPSVAYAVSNATTLTFTAAPSSNAGNNIFVYYLASQVGTVGHPSNQALSATNGTFSGNTTVAGTSTFTGDVTVGDGSAADKKILFDGNAQDYHIGLDDSADSLIIGKGSALGTTTSMAIDANGIITKPLQPAFQVNKNDTNQDNIATDTVVVVTWEIERFDVNSDFDLTNNQFTAPVTGKYFLSANIRIDSVDTAAGFYNIMVVTSNKTYTSIIDPNFSADLNYITRTVAITADMDAGDTAQVKAVQSGGTAQADLDGASEYTSFSGHLVC